MRLTEQRPREPPGALWREAAPRTGTAASLRRGFDACRSSGCVDVNRVARWTALVPRSSYRGPPSGAGR